MARSLWTGSLSFGLVNVPVRVITAVRDRDLHFRQLHESDGAPIDVQRWCSEEHAEVPYEEITRAHELDDGGQVTISDLELQAIEPRKTRTIDIEQFVDLAEVDPIYFDHPYFLVPASEDDGSARAYRLLTEVMSRTERAAVGRFVMRAKEHLAIVREREGALTLTTMLFADEIRDTKEIDQAIQKAHKPTRKQLDAAVAVIEELSNEWEPDKHKDRYRARLKRVVDRKRKGETIKPPPAAEQPAPPEDLMAALERTLAEIKDGGSGRWSDRREPQQAG
jgi:DNA end-binding protein Ku